MDKITPEVLVAIVNGVLSILSRHVASGATTPLTNEEVHAQLLQDLQNGETAIAVEFAAKGWALPQ